MAQGNGTFINASIMYVLPGASATLLRARSAASFRYRRSYSILDTMEVATRPKGLRRVLAYPGVLLSVLLIGTILLPAQRWRHLTATMVYDVIGALSIVIITQNLRDTTSSCPTTSTAPI